MNQHEKLGLFFIIAGWHIVSTAHLFNIIAIANGLGHIQSSYVCGGVVIVAGTVAFLCGGKQQ